MREGLALFLDTASGRTGGHVASEVFNSSEMVIEHARIFRDNFLSVF